jgi:hypothetical protein
MATTEGECLDALRTAAEQLGESPTKAQYEELGLTPASATVLRVMGGWNEAKTAAGLETYEQGSHGGPPIDEQPADVDLPEGKEWADLSGNQRWYYKNREEQAAKKERRRDRARRWVYEYKRDNCECERCGEGTPACLDFHHEDSDEKELGVGEMVGYGYAVSSIRREIDQCTVLCANCHRKVHHETPPPVETPAGD